MNTSSAMLAELLVAWYLELSVLQALVLLTKRYSNPVAAAVHDASRFKPLRLGYDDLKSVELR